MAYVSDENFLLIIDYISIDSAGGPPRVQQGPALEVKGFGDPRTIACMGFSSKCDFLAISSTGCHLSIWDANARRPVRTPGGRGEHSNELAFNGEAGFVVFGGPEEKEVLVAADSLGQFAVWTAATWEPLGLYLCQTGKSIAQVKVAESGESIAVLQKQAGIEVWRRDLSRQTDAKWYRDFVYQWNLGIEVGEIAMSPGARILVACSSDGLALLWDTETRQRIGQAFRIHEGEVIDVLLSWRAGALMLSSLGMDQVVWNENLSELFDIPSEASDCIRSVGSGK